MVVTTDQNLRYAGQELLNTEKWYGPLKTLNQELYKNCSSNGNGEEAPFAEQLEELAGTSLSSFFSSSFFSDG